MVREPSVSSTTAGVVVVALIIRAIGVDILVDVVVYVSSRGGT
jgi:hypothetical protein